ncbi:MAG: hypothetical protein ACFFFG_08860 [Candidatus Thorarchaeota archaeon]
MFKLVSEYRIRFRSFYTQSRTKRFLSGITIVAVITGTASLSSVILRILMQGDDLWQSFMDDIPWIGLIVALIIALDIWGLLPSSTGNKQDSAKQNVNSNIPKPNNKDNRLPENLEYNE